MRMAGIAGAMGLIERWDRRNQRILEWHNHVADDERRHGRGPFGSISWKGLLAGWLGSGVVTAVLDHFLGFAWTMGILTGAIVAFFSVFVVTQRQMRRAWEATRGSAAREA